MDLACCVSNRWEHVAPMRQGEKVEKGNDKAFESGDVERLRKENSIIGNRKQSKTHTHNF